MGSKVTDTVHALVFPLCSELGYELVDVEYAKQGSRYILRLLIDKPGGITLEDCELLSRRVDPLLDQSDPIPGSYALEVSSPGLDRPLKRSNDFERFTGSQVKIKTFSVIDNRRSFTGKLMGFNNGNVVIEQDGSELAIPFDQVAKANLVPEL